MAQNFRSAFNGFNKEDVVHYLEYINNKHTSQINQLTAEADALRQQLQEIPGEKTQLEMQLQDLKRENADLLSRAEQTEREKKAIEARAAELEKKLKEAASARSELEVRCEELNREKAQIQETPKQTVVHEVAGYRSVDQELETYRRAERMERGARERAEKIYRQTNSVLADATRKVDSAASQIGSIAEQVMSQLEQLQTAVNSSKLALRDAAATMYHIRPEDEE